MKLKEFLNTNQNDWVHIYIYYDLDDYENETPEETYRDMRDIDKVKLGWYIDAWYMDVNFNLHVLLSNGMGGSYYA